MARCLVVLLMAMTLVSACFAELPPVRINILDKQPAVRFGAEELAKAIRTAGRPAEVEIGWTVNPKTGEGFVGVFDIQLRTPKSGSGGSLAGPDAAESYILRATPSGLTGDYSDETAGMYALLDLAEQVKLKGLKALDLKQIVSKKPAIAFRGVNPFLSIPIADKNGKRDCEHWWFTDESYWRGYLDLLAKAHINWIDMHAMFDLQVTTFPNVWPYFVVSAKYPDVGVEPAQARKNLAMLQKICKMAKARGIKFGLMARLPKGARAAGRGLHRVHQRGPEADR